MPPKFPRKSYGLSAYLAVEIACNIATLVSTAMLFIAMLANDGQGNLVNTGFLASDPLQQTLTRSDRCLPTPIRVVRSKKRSSTPFFFTSERYRFTDSPHLPPNPAELLRCFETSGYRPPSGPRLAEKRCKWQQATTRRALDWLFVPKFGWIYFVSPFNTLASLSHEYESQNNNINNTMRNTRTVGAALLVASSPLVSALTLDVTNLASIKSAASTVAHGMMSYYSGNVTNTTSTIAVLPAPYYWWEAGAMWGAMLDYYHYTGDPSYNEVVTQALLSQVGPNSDFMVPAHKGDEGNDDQAFWGFAAMSAAEKDYPQPSTGDYTWVQLVENLWNTQVQRWDTEYCGGGLRWQIFSSNAGYNYKNSVSNGAFFQLSARLARFTGNQTYMDWATKSYEWANNTGLITPDYHVYDGADLLKNCTAITKLIWTYNAGIYLYGSAVMYNYTNGSDMWQERTQGFLNSTANFFTPFDNATDIMYEPACETVGACDNDQYSFKAYLSRFMWAATLLAPFTNETTTTLLTKSAQAAATACSGPSDGVTCGQKWYTGGYDGKYGVGEQMKTRAMEALGVASSIAGLISLAEVVVSKGSKYVHHVKNARADIKDLMFEVQSLYGVLSRLRLLANCLEDEETAGSERFLDLDHFQICRKNLDHLKRSLAKLGPDPTKGKLLWPFKSSGNKDLIDKITRNKRDLTDVLTADGLCQQQFLKAVEKKIENEKDETKKNMYKWCSKFNPYEKHRNANGLRYPNTVTWFFDSPEYKVWLETPNSGIWLYGIPGAGKTILTSAVIEEVKFLAYQNGGFAVAYYYCEYKLEQTQRLSNILGSLIIQLCAYSEDAFEELSCLYSKCNDERHVALPTNSELETLLKRLPRTIKIIYTSRDEVDIRSHFESFQGISVAAHSGDLELFVAAGIEQRIQNKTLQLKDSSLREEITNTIVSKANGMFQ
ncbi:hypothetical protein G7Y89_g3034 [Cudoniella acicularis]|uniref:mannan endo-1,6-alpha-mannosidase n=1 Tax=Cudoniella acicularis TaxID=354080 RepID=A0A8H4RU09_9HELO|nr:hypothetical protein G7Y89_g3034 [Cudoniella acicularis]